MLYCLDTCQFADNEKSHPLTARRAQILRMCNTIFTSAFVCEPLNCDVFVNNGVKNKWLTVLESPFKKNADQNPTIITNLILKSNDNSNNMTSACVKDLKWPSTNYYQPFSLRHSGL